jgi:hypothetical protein
MKNPCFQNQLSQGAISMFSPSLQQSNGEAKTRTERPETFFLSLTTKSASFDHGCSNYLKDSSGRHLSKKEKILSIIDATLLFLSLDGLDEDDEEFLVSLQSEEEGQGPKESQ